MKYENRTIPEGINVSEEHPLKEFSILFVGVGALTVLLVVVLSFASGWLVSYVPFHLEKKLAASFVEKMELGQSSLNSDQEVIQRYLQTLSDELALAQVLPEDMSITVHYVDDDVVNGFATLGGHVFIHRGLMQKLESENALAQLLAHEIAHIKQRAPVKSLGRGLVVSLALEAVLGESAGSLSRALVGNVSTLTSLSFSRDQEKQADIEALHTLQKHYGHIFGAKDLYLVLMQESDGKEPFKLLSTHPLTQERIDNIDAFDGLHEGELTALPDFILALKT